MEIIKKYFPDLPADQLERINALWPVYKEWNQKINVISRKDTAFFYERHVLHSLSFMKAISFNDGTAILDAGTGGGFPGIPLAICFPECHFTLADSIGKKIRVVREVAQDLGLKNVTAFHGRVEEIDGQFDFVVSRAVKSLPVFVPWVIKKIRPGGNYPIPNGILYLKGGDVDDEIKAVGLHHKVFALTDWFDETYFETKKILALWKHRNEKLKI